MCHNWDKKKSIIYVLQSPWDKTKYVSLNVLSGGDIPDWDACIFKKPFNKTLASIQEVWS